MFVLDLKCREITVLVIHYTTCGCVAPWIVNVSDDIVFYANFKEKYQI